LPLLLYGTGRPSNNSSSGVENDDDRNPIRTDHRASKLHLLSLVRHLHILQPKVFISSDIAHRIAFWGWCALDAEDKGIVIEEVQSVLGPIAALWTGRTLLCAAAAQEQTSGSTGRPGKLCEIEAQGLMPSLTRVEVSSCDHYTWQSLDSGGGTIRAYQDLLADCRQVILALAAPWLYHGGRQPSQSEWVQRTANGPFAFPRTRVVDPKIDLGGRSGVFDGTFEVALVADLLLEVSCYPPLLSGLWNQIRLRRPMRERLRTAEVLLKMLDYVVEEIELHCHGELKDDTIVDFVGLFEVEAASFEEELQGLAGSEDSEVDQGMRRKENQVESEKVEAEKTALLREIDRAVEPRWRGKIYLSARRPSW